MAFEKCWRWFGVNDGISLSQLREMGIEGVVTALHHIPNGQVWPVEEIQKVQREIEKFGMYWSVVESLPVHEEIKQKGANAEKYILNYQQSLRNLGRCGIDLVVYNFMPVIDWIRTSLNYITPNGTSTMMFHYPALAAFDIYILKRTGAELDYPPEIREAALKFYTTLSAEASEELAHNLIVVTQGFIDGVVKGTGGNYKQLFLDHINRYKSIDAAQLRQNLADFLSEILPVAKEAGIKMVIHPDDPPYPVLGLPRIAGSADDIRQILQMSESSHHGITFCTGSLAARHDNRIPEMAVEFAHRTHFLHLRNIDWIDDHTFYESGHLDGVVDMAELMTIFLKEQARRVTAGIAANRMPLRPDHGVSMLTDLGENNPPGYPLIGRLRGLSELRGLEAGIAKHLGNS